MYGQCYRQSKAGISTFYFQKDTDNKTHFQFQLFSPQNPRQVTPFPSFSCNKLLDEYVYGIHLYPIMTLKV